MTWGPERSFWYLVSSAFDGYGLIRRVEDMTRAGLPDCVYCVNGHVGWCELKALRAWPKRPATPVRVPSLTLEQVRFLEVWEKHRGRASLLLRVDEHWFALGPAAVADLYTRGLGREELAKRSRGDGKFPILGARLIQGLVHGLDR